MGRGLMKCKVKTGLGSRVCNFCGHPILHLMFWCCCLEILNNVWRYILQVRSNGTLESMFVSRGDVCDMHVCHFLTLHLHSGLNVLWAQKSHGPTVSGSSARCLLLNKWGHHNPRSFTFNSNRTCLKCRKEATVF